MSRGGQKVNLFLETMFDFLAMCTKKGKSVMDRDSNTHVNITHVWQDNESVKTKTLLTLNGSIHSNDLSRLTPTSDESTKIRVIFRYDYSHAPDGRYDAIRP